MRFVCRRHDDPFSATRSASRPQSLWSTRRGAESNLAAGSAEIPCHPVHERRRDRPVGSVQCLAESIDSYRHRDEREQAESADGYREM